MNKLKEFLKNNSAFRHMAIGAIVFGTASITCSLIDLFWVLGDMSIAVHSHHIVVLVGLSVANIIGVLAFIWIVRGIMVYLNSHTDKTIRRKRLERKVEIEELDIASIKRRLDVIEQLMGKK